MFFNFMLKRIVINRIYIEKLILFENCKIIKRSVNCYIICVIYNCVIKSCNEILKYLV